MSGDAETCFIYRMGGGGAGDMLGDRLEQWGLLVLASRFRVCRKGISGMSPHGAI